MVGGGVFSEYECQLVGRYTAGCVDDCGTIGRGLEEIGRKLIATWLRHLDNFNGEIVTSESVDEEGGTAELELSDDVFLDGGCGCCCEGDDGCGAEGGKVIAEGTVVGAKVVAPG